MKQLSLVALLFVFSSPAMAYVGPGLGMGVIGAIFGVLAAILLAIFGLFWYPIKRAFKKNKTPVGAGQSANMTPVDDLQGNCDNVPAQTDTISDTASNKRTDTQVK